MYALCPRGHRMPDHAFDLPSIVVGLVGESASGKTVYLGTLLEQLDRGRLLPYLDLEPDEHSEQLQNQIFGEFYRIGQVPEATAAGRSDAQREALTRTAKSEGVERFYLSFFDASGEQNKRQDHGTHNRFLFRGRRGDALHHPRGGRAHRSHDRPAAGPAPAVARDQRRGALRREHRPAGHPRRGDRPQVR